MALRWAFFTSVCVTDPGRAAVTEACIVGCRSSGILCLTFAPHGLYRRHHFVCLHPMGLVQRLRLKLLELYSAETGQGLQDQWIQKAGMAGSSCTRHMYRRT